MKLNKNLNINRYEWVENILNESELIRRSKKPILFDIGANDEILLKFCNTSIIQYNSFDISPVGRNTRSWDLEIPFPYKKEKADIITLLEVVEHLNNPWQCLKNLSDIMKIGGLLLLTTPNPSWSNSRLHLFLKGKLATFTQSDLDLNHHVFTPWPHILERLLTDNGFEVIEYVTLDGQTYLFDKNLRISGLFPQIIYRVFKKTIEFFDPSSKGMSYGIIAKKTR
ncbi:class I SAM-dependent methyltransferase [Daejeonella oryzae]|uniref:class I SAM-dependent methyltransferase n=1 Tax=Daejeonella oryzae TaxID=1122943 RepID=UPI0004027F03|nr:class I SAM-dependent methyltransferase [Daejeonella oryzae]